MGSKGKRYSPQFKFNVVLDALESEKSDADKERTASPPHDDLPAQQSRLGHSPG